MSKINSPAFPACNKANVNDTMGLTKREYFATCAPEPPITWWGSHDRPTCAGHAMWAVQYADALIAELAKGGDS